jgi:hypothetical protein
MGINFPNAPTTGQLYPQPAVAGMPVYRWDGAKWLIQTAATATVDSDVGRNLIHNSLFNIQQRGVGPWTTFVYTADRWKLLGSTDAINASVVAQSDGGRAQIGDESSRYTFQAGVTGNAGAGAFSALAQTLEGVLRLSGKTVTISFYAYCATTQKIGVNLIQSFGTGGSPSPAMWALATGAAVTVGPTWARYSVTIPIPSAAGKTLGTNGDESTGLWLWLSSGANNNAVAGNIGVQTAVCNIWGVQLEVGSVASSLEKPDPQQDLAKCQRFYCSLAGLQFGCYGVAGSNMWASWTFPVAMRAIPAMASSNVAYSNSSGFVINTYTPTSFGAYIAAVATGSFEVSFNATASADL